MRKAAILLLLTLCACAHTDPAAPDLHTITVTKTVPVLPPANLFDKKGLCETDTPHSSGTVRDALNALVDERAINAACRGDRAALRTWVNGVSK